MSSARQQVKAEIIRMIADAQAAGLGNGVAAVHRAYPDIPEMILWECWTDLDLQRQDAWWETIERTIDGEIIRRAIASPVESSSGGGR